MTFDDWTRALAAEVREQRKLYTSHLVDDTELVLNALTALVHKVNTEWTWSKHQLGWGAYEYRGECGAYLAVLGPNYSERAREFGGVLCRDGVKWLEVPVMPLEDAKAWCVEAAK